MDLLSLIEKDQALQSSRKDLEKLAYQSLIHTYLTLGPATPYPGRTAQVLDVEYRDEIYVKVRVEKHNGDGYLDSWNPFVRCYRPLREITQQTQIVSPEETRIQLMLELGA